MTPLVISMSILLAFLAAGVVWYGWGFAENILAIRSNRRIKSEPEDPEGTDEENAEEAPR